MQADRLYCLFTSSAQVLNQIFQKALQELNPAGLFFYLNIFIPLQVFNLFYPSFNLSFLP